MPTTQQRYNISDLPKLSESLLAILQILVDMKILTAYGLKSLDALHVACAIALKCDYFLTVDKGILKKSSGISSIAMISPIDFVIQQEIS